MICHLTINVFDINKENKNGKPVHENVSLSVSSSCSKKHQLVFYDWNFTFSLSCVFTKQMWPHKLYWLGISWLGNSRTLFLFFRASLTFFIIALMRSCQTIIVKKTMLAIFQKLYYILLENWAGINQCKHENSLTHNWKNWKFLCTHSFYFINVKRYQYIKYQNPSYPQIFSWKEISCTKQQQTFVNI